MRSVEAEMNHWVGGANVLGVWIERDLSVETEIGMFEGIVISTVFLWL